MDYNKKGFTMLLHAGHIKKTADGKRLFIRLEM